MSEKDFGKKGVKTLRIHKKLEESALNSIRKVLPDKIIDMACSQSNYSYRQRTITPVVVVLHYIISAIWPEESFNSCWQVMWAGTAAGHPEITGHCPARGSVSTARNRLPREVMDKIFNWLAEQSQILSEKYDRWRGHRVVLVDGTCMTMPDHAELYEEFGVHDNNRYPLAKMVGLCLSNTMTVISYNVGKYVTDENALLKPLLKTLQKGDLLVGDRHYAGANLYWRYRIHGLEFLTRAHQRLKISKIKPLVIYSNRDFIGYVKTGKRYRSKDPLLPKKIKVRFICSTLMIRGKKKDVWFVTSLLDADAYPAEEIVKLYGDRWRIETLFRELKINAHADILRSQKVDGIYREIAGRFAAVNIVRTIMLEAAIEHDLEDPIRISFSDAMRIVLAFAPALALRPVIMLPSIYKAMLHEIASHLVPWRPGRNEPRKLAHDPRKYPKLKETRQQWRNENAA